MQTDDMESLAERVDNLSLRSEENASAEQNAPGPAEHSDMTASANLEVTSENECDPILPDGSEVFESTHVDQPRKLSKDRLVTAGIDLGTAISRVTLAYVERRAYCDVQNPEWSPDSATANASIEFPAVVDVKTGEMGYADALVGGIPVQTVLYELLRLEAPSTHNHIYMGINFHLLMARGVSDANMSVLRDKGRLRGLLVKYFEKIRHAMMICCTRNKLFYESVAITIPAICNVTEFMQSFIGIITDAFPFIPRRNICLIPRAEAIGCTITDGITMDQVRDPRNDLPYPDELMVVDFGGYALHGTSLTLVWDDTQRHRVNSNPAFFALEASWGMMGGMELYAQMTEEAIRDSMINDPEMTNYAEKEELIIGLMADFRQKCPYLGRSPFILNSSRGDWYSGTLALGLWEAAFLKPLALVHHHIMERTRTKLPTIVSLTGDSYRNREVLKTTLTEINNYGKYGWKHYEPFDDGRFLAVRGAAWATRHRRDDVRKFLRACNLKFMFHWIEDPQKPARKWSKRETEFKLYRDSVLWVTCEPYVSAPGKKEYKLAQLGTRRKGTFSIRRGVVFDEEKQQYTLVLDERKLNGKTGKVMSRAKWDLPMYYDVGRRVPLIEYYCA